MYIRSKQFNDPVAFLQKFNDLVTTLDEMSSTTRNDETIIVRLQKACSDNDIFCACCSLEKRIATVGGAAFTYEKAYEAFMAAACQTNRELAATSGTRRSVNCTLRSRPRMNTIPTDIVHANPYINWIVRSTDVRHTDIQSSDPADDDPNDSDGDALESAYQIFKAAASWRFQRDRNPTTNIPSHIFRDLPSPFKKEWSSLSPKEREMINKSIIDRAYPDQMDTLSNNVPSWKRDAMPPPLPPKKPFRRANNVSSEYTDAFFDTNDIRSDADLVALQVALNESAPADAGGETQGVSFEIDVNAAASKASNKSKPKTDPLTVTGSIQQLMKAPKGTIANLKVDGKVRKIEAKHARIEANNVKINTDGSEHMHYATPPLRTQFNSQFNHRAMFVQNDLRAIPYQDGPLTEASRCDSILTKTKKKRRMHVKTNPKVKSYRTSKHKQASLLGIGIFTHSR